MMHEYLMKLVLVVIINGQLSWPITLWDFSGNQHFEVLYNLFKNENKHTNQGWTDIFKVLNSYKQHDKKYINAWKYSEIFKRATAGIFFLDVHGMCGNKNIWESANF